MTTEAPLLALEQVAVAAGGIPLVAGLDLALRAGELVGLSGPSGCGKTSLLRAVSGLEDPAGGAVRLEGRTAGEIGWPDYRRRVVLVPQTPVWPAGTLREGLARPFAYASVGEDFPEERARELLGRLRLDAALLGRETADLSVGEQQRGQLVRAALLRPRVLLLDEPTSALDGTAVGLVEAWLREMAGEGLAALVVTHDAAQAERLCGRTVRIGDYAPRSEPAAAGREG
jgi:ABC-type iron transport system FetAB ATPase subunit